MDSKQVMFSKRTAARSSLALILGLSVSAPTSGTQSCRTLRDLNPAGAAIARAITPDGHVAVGRAGAPGQGAACFWRAGAPPTFLGVPGGVSTAQDVSADGSVIVGTLQGPGGTGSAFLWTAATGAQLLPGLGGQSSFCYAVSADGSVAVGSSSTPGSPVLRACMWTTAGVQDLGTLGGTYSEARDVSADGSVVVGLALDAAGATHAFRWTTNGMTAPIPSVYSEAYGVSADGETLVGIAIFGNLGQAFRWSAAGGLDNVGPGSLSFGCSVSDDGDVVVGNSENANFELRPFVWTAASGFLDLGAPPGTFGSAADVTADGGVAVGHSGSTAWLTHLPAATLGAPFCDPTVTNSSGCWGEVLATGSATASQNTFEVTARNLPAGVFGFVMLSQTQTGPTPAPSGQGMLCLGESIGRLVAPGQVMRTELDGRFSVAVDLTSLPSGAGAGAVQPGESWSFQAWYRDTNPGPTSNLTSALAVTFL